VLQQQRTRAAIVRAALECVAAGGWDSTSLHALRQRAGVSNGSLFHHFPTRQDLTAAVVAVALRQHQQVLLAELVDDAQHAVMGVVRRHLRWVNDNQAIAQLLLSTPPNVLRESVSAHALEENREFFRAVAAWLREHDWPGNPELPVLLALWIGPAQEYSRQRLASTDRTPSLAAAEDLADGAWAALSPLLNRSLNSATRKGRTEGE